MNALLIVTFAIVVIAALLIWARRFRAYGLAIAPKRRNLAVPELRLTSVRETAHDRLALTFEAVPDESQSQTIVVELDDRALALETLEAWRKENAPVTFSAWGNNLIRVRRLDAPSALTLRRVVGPNEGDAGVPDDPS